MTTPTLKARSGAGWLAPLALPVVMALSGAWAPGPVAAASPDAGTLPVSRSRSEPRDDGADHQRRHAASDSDERTGRGEATSPSNRTADTSPRAESESPGRNSSAFDDRGSRVDEDRSRAEPEPDTQAQGAAVHIGGEGIDSAPGGDPDAAGAGAGAAGGTAPPAIVPAARRHGSGSSNSRSRRGGADAASNGPSAGGAFSGGRGNGTGSDVPGGAAGGPGQGTGRVPGVPFGPAVPPPVRSGLGSGVAVHATAPFHPPGATLLAIPARAASAASVASERAALPAPVRAPAAPLARTGGETSASTMLAVGLILVGRALRRAGRQTRAGRFVGGWPANH